MSYDAVTVYVISPLIGPDFSALGMYSTLLEVKYCTCSMIYLTSQVMALHIVLWVH